MSRGIGKLQRQIIAAGAATRTVWDVVPSVMFKVAHDSPMPGLNETGDTWRVDGKPYFWGWAWASSLAEYVTLCETYRRVEVERPVVKHNAHLPVIQIDESSAAACWVEDSIYLGVYPDLFAVDHREPTHCKRKDGSHVWGQMMLPHDIRKAKASAKSNIVRAMRSLVSRHRVSGVFLLNPPREVAAARGWRGRYGKNCGLGWARLVLHPDALVHAEASGTVGTHEQTDAPVAEHAGRARA